MGQNSPPEDTATGRKRLDSSVALSRTETAVESACHVYPSGFLVLSNTHRRHQRCKSETVFLCDAGVVRCTRRCFKTTQLDGVDSGHYARLRIWGLSNVVLRYDARHAAYSCSGEGVTSCLASSTNIEMR